MNDSGFFVVPCQDDGLFLRQRDRRVRLAAAFFSGFLQGYLEIVSFSFGCIDHILSSRFDELEASPANIGETQEALSMATQLNTSELQRWRQERREFALIDVLPEEAFAERHLPGAKKACVYEVDFLDQIAKLGIGRDQPIVVYGAGPDSLESATAAEKLDRAGFAQVFDFRGGRADWEAAGGEFEGTGKANSTSDVPTDRECTVDVEKSTVEWIGRNLASTHRGTVRISEGRISVRAGMLSRGTITLDLRSIQDTDLEDPEMRKLLEHHLKSDDFFDVERFPTAELVLLSASPISESMPGSPNFRFAAELAIKGATRPIEFPAIVAEGEDGTLTAVAQVEIDRTRWNVLYGSGRFYRMLGKHLVADLITLLVKIVAK